MQKNGITTLLRNCNRQVLALTYLPEGIHRLEYKRLLSEIRSPVKDTQKTDELLRKINQTHLSTSTTKRFILLRDLIKYKKFDRLIKTGDKLLLETDLIQNKIRWKYDVSLKEYLWYFHSLTVTHKWEKINQHMLQMISQFSISNKRKCMTIIASTTRHMIKIGVETHNESFLVDILVFWTGWVKRLNGNCELLDYMSDKVLLCHILNVIRDKSNIAKDKPESLTNFLENILIKVKREHGPSSASQLASTFMSLLQRDRYLNEVEPIWKFKTKNLLPIISRDLTIILKSYIYQHRYQDIQDVYENHPQAHGEIIQFDYLLLSYTRLKKWSSLQRQFEDLFGIGKLPNVNQYEIVLFALSYERELEKVEMLYNQFLRRKMVPTYSILQSLLYVHYKNHNFLSCFEQFQLFEKYNVEPSESTYLLMFKVYKELNNMEGALKLLREITQKDGSKVNESMISVMIQQCSKVTNYLIAQELFNIMSEYYNIKPSSKSISSLMDVFNSCGDYNKGISIFKKYIESVNSESDAIWLYEKALDSYIGLADESACSKVIETVKNIFSKYDKTYYQILLKYETTYHPENTKQIQEILNELIEKHIITPRHIEIVMTTLDKTHQYDSIFQIYELMIQNHIPLNSKILYFIIKTTFQLQMQRKQDLTSTINLLTDIMDNLSQGKLKLSPGSQLHPSVFQWAIRGLARNYNPNIAMGLINKYNKLIGFNNSGNNNKLNNLRTIIIVYGELNQFEQVRFYWNILMSTLNRFQSQPTSTMNNRKLISIFDGIINYKLKQLEEDECVNELPQLIQSLLNKGYQFDNNTWNAIVLTLMKNHDTLELSMEYINDRLIHGYNCVHKRRFLKKHRGDIFNGYMPELKLYLQSGNYVELFSNMSKKLNQLTFDEYEKLILETWCVKYPHIMKNYLLKKHESTVHNWNQFEINNKSLLTTLRNVKRSYILKEKK